MRRAVGRRGDVEDVVTLRGADYELTLTGAHAVASGSVSAGQPLADVHRRAAWVELGVRPVGAPAAPLFSPVGAGAGLAGADP